MRRDERKRPTHCRQCHGEGTPDAPISWRGLCVECAIANVAANNRAMASRSGPEYEEAQARARAGLLAYARKLAAG